MAPTRKKHTKKDEWKRNVNKKARHVSKKLPSLPKCSHPKKNVFLCQQLTMQDVRRFHQGFYESATKIDQDNYILKHTNQVTPDRHRKRLDRNNEDKERKNAVTIKYFVKTRGRGQIQVCAKAFLNILDISKYRVQNISKKYYIDG